jgi:hypothetical protein
MMACTLDLLHWGSISHGGQRDPLRDPTRIPPSYYICAQAVPRMRDQLELVSVGSDQCLTQRSPSARAPANLDLPSYQ